MRNIIVPLISGIVFGIGLVIAGMTNPAKVMGFLNIYHRVFLEWLNNQQNKKEVCHFF